MNKKGIAWATLVIIIILLVSFVIIFGWQLFFSRYIKEEGEAVSCKTSVIKAGLDIAKLGGGDLPALSGCEKIPIKIGSEDKEGIQEELLGLLVDASEDFSVSRKTYSGISGMYCRRRYHPITFKKSGLVIENFKDYFVSNKPADLVGDFSVVVNSINTNKEYSVLFVAIYEGMWDKFVRDITEIGLGAYTELALGGLGYRKKGSNYLGFALVESSKLLSVLDCDHLV